MKSLSIKPGWGGGRTEAPSRFIPLVVRASALICVAFLIVSMVSVVLSPEAVGQSGSPEESTLTEESVSPDAESGETADPVVEGEESADPVVEGGETADPVLEGAEVPSLGEGDDRSQSLVADANDLDDLGSEQYYIRPVFNRTATGTGHGGSSGCVLNSGADIPFQGGDDSAEDDVVCTRDWVKYNIELSVKTKPVEPEDFTVVLDLWTYDIPFLNGRYASTDTNREIITQYGLEPNADVAVSKGFSDFCTSRAGQWSTVRKIVKVGEKYVPACTFTPDAGLDLAYKQSLSALADIKNTSLSEARVYVVRGNIEDKYGTNDSRVPVISGVEPTVAQGYNVVGVADIDFYVEEHGEQKKTIARIDGKDYIGKPYSLQYYAKKRGVGSYDKGSLYIERPAGEPQKIPITIEGAPEGSFVTSDPTGQTVQDISFQGRTGHEYPLRLNGATDGPLPFFVFYPADSVEENLGSSFTYRVKKELGTISTVGGPLVNGGDAEIGSGEDCDFDTSSIGGYDPGDNGQGDAPKNNNCGVSRIERYVAGDLLRKQVSGIGVAGYEYIDDDGVKQRIDGITQGGQIHATIWVEPVPGDRNVEICDVWDPAEQRLLYEYGGSYVSVETPGYGEGISEDRAVHGRNFTTLYSSQYNSDTGCGVPGSTEGWEDEPENVPGGKFAVSAVKVVSKNPVTFVKGGLLALMFTPAEGMDERVNKFGFSEPAYDHAYINLDNPDEFQGPASASYRYVSPFIVGQNEFSSGFSDPNSNLTAGRSFNWSLIPYYQQYGFSDDYLMSTSFFAKFDACLDVSGAVVKARKARGSGIYPENEVDERWEINIDRGEDIGEVGCADDEPITVTASLREPIPFSEAAVGYLSVNGQVSPLVKADEVHVGAKFSWSYRNGQGDLVEKENFERYFGTGVSSNGLAIYTKPVNYVKSLSASKTVDKESVDLDESFSWTLGFRNTFDGPVRGVRWIDVLPFDGDDRGTDTSGRVSLSDINASDKLAVEYTRRTPRDIVNDPDDPTNLPGGSTKWCADLTSGDPNCPSSLEEVTAVRMSADFDPGELLTFKMTASVVGGTNGDELVNRSSVGKSLEEGQLKAPVPAPDPVRTRLVAATIEGHVYLDKDGSGYQDYDEDDYENATVTLVNSAGDVVLTKQTDSEGNYAFSQLSPGTYTVKIDVPDGMYLKRSGPDPANQGKNTVENLVIPEGDPITIGEIDFGLVDPQPSLIVQKVIHNEATDNYEKSVERSVGETVSFYVAVFNDGTADLTDVKLVDDWDGGDFDLSCQVMAAGGAAGEGDHGSPLSDEGGVLSPNQGFLCTGEYVVTEADVAAGTSLTNTASATAMYGGEVVQGPSDSVVVELVTSAGFDFTKSVVDGKDFYVPGEVVSYELKVSNTGDVTLKDVRVDDPLVSDAGGEISCNDGDGVVAPGDSLTCTVAYTVGDGDVGEDGVGVVSNVATAHATPVNGEAFEPKRGEVSVDVRKAGIAVVKTADASEPVGVDGEVSYGFTVTNSGTAPLDGVRLSDPMLEARGVGVECGDRGQLTGEGVRLDAGEVVSCSATVQVGQDDLDLADGGQLVNEVTVSGEVHGLRVEASDEVTTALDVRAGVALDKKVAEPERRYTPGSEVSYSFDVRNTGAVTLTDVEVSDPMLRNVRCSGTDVAPGAVLECTADPFMVDEEIADRGVLVNTATVRAQTRDGRSVEASDSVEVATGSPGLVITKSASTTGPVEAGDMITWEIRVRNNGTTPVEKVRLSDPMFGEGELSCDVDGVVGPDGATLGVGEQVVCTAETVVSQADVDAETEVVNTATVTGEFGDFKIGELTATATAPVSSRSGLTVAKSVVGYEPGMVYRVGDEITYRFVVTNTGAVSLRDIEVVDEQLRKAGVEVVCDNSTPLEPGATRECTSGVYTVTQDQAAAGSVDNAATVNGVTLTRGSGVTSEEDQVSVPAADPRLVVTKTADPVGPVGSGETVSFTVSVRNEGNTAVDGVKVSDPWLRDRGTELDCGVTGEGSSLQVGESLVCTAEITVNDSDVVGGGVLVNTATAEGVVGGRVVRGNEASVSVELKRDAAIAVTKDVVDGERVYRVGESVVFGYTVTNGGRVELSGVTLTDESVSGIDCPDVRLAPGASMTCRSQPHVVTGSDADAGRYGGPVTVVATIPDDMDPGREDRTVSATDSAEVTVEKDDSGVTGSTGGGAIIPIPVPVPVPGGGPVGDGQDPVVSGVPEPGSDVPSDGPVKGHGGEDGSVADGEVPSVDRVPERLPVTGANVLVAVGVGLVLALAGFGLVFAVRRRRDE
ncbi:LPXTG cell wall anchor domain-containing protein [Corynebacterium sp. P7202]|uniref:LPXTG cell wall anchor domain-containing protein n=1 Tax=Corynebacterium pygosceleis TaxID=2800406 RepID=A0A9Q4CBA4_9CORY|nr:SdrD B-like domain-containing protein [Corynebacterium pygosceleis]MCK7638335.1 LPXTG cell wall anchor domain-containing protein [Corynebacterium pygosceleis]MCX7468998.1 LPXTG cell wall anchor domain-containing protein [Corynebacterium pygosceleis]